MNPRFSTITFVLLAGNQFFFLLLNYTESFQFTSLLCDCVGTLLWWIMPFLVGSFVCVSLFIWRRWVCIQMMAQIRSFRAFEFKSYNLYGLISSEWFKWITLVRAKNASSKWRMSWMYIMHLRTSSTIT